MSHKFILVSCFLILGGCSSILVQPDFKVDDKGTGATTADYSVTEIIPTIDLILSENSRPFKRKVSVFDSENGNLVNISLSEFSSESLPKKFAIWDYRLAPGDTISLTRSKSTHENFMDSFFTEELDIDRQGYVKTSDGFAFSLSGLPSQKLTNFFEEALRQDDLVYDDEIEEKIFPKLKKETYKLGAGDLLKITRLVSNGETSTGEVARLPIAFEALVEEDGAIQYIELDGRLRVDGLTLTEVQETIKRELIRSGLEAEVTVNIINYGSSSVIITGDLGDAIVPLTSDINTVDRLITVLRQNKNLEIRHNIDYLVSLHRNSEIFNMRLSSLLINSRRDLFFLINGDKLNIKKINRAPKVKAFVTKYRSRSAILIFEDTNENQENYVNIFEDEVDKYELNGKVARIYLGEQGLKFYDLVIDFALWPSEDSDYIFVLTRGNDTYHFSVKAIIERGERNSFYLQNGDIIELKLPNFNLDDFYVIGETQRAYTASVTPRKRAYLSDALFRSGVFNIPEADFRHIYLLRRENKNSFKAIHFDISNALNLTLLEKMELRPSDIVLVKTQPLYEFNRVLNAFLGVAQRSVAAFQLGSDALEGQLSND